MNTLIDFINKSPSQFHAVENIACELEKNGFTHIAESEFVTLKAGGKYYITRNMSSIIAFEIPDTDFKSYMICASHSDSPAFMLKGNYEMDTFGKYIRINTEKYGGMIMSSWFDRPLSVAGRVIVRENGRFVQKLVNIDRDLLIIPNVAIHFNRTINDGYKYNAQTDTIPLMGTMASQGLLKKLIAQAANTEPDNIAGSDLFVYNREKGYVWGADNEFISAPKIDNLECAWTSLQGFLTAETTSCVRIYACFDNEETGSSSKQGANSTFLQDVLTYINSSFGRTTTDLYRALASSFMISADNAHAKHPNHPELSDQTNSPNINEGVVIKFNASQKYATDGISSAIFESICKSTGVPFQRFANRSDQPGGSTLGSISNTRVSVNTVDIGLAQLAMHSSFETAGSLDADYMINVCRKFFSSEIIYNPDKSYLLK